MDDLLRINKWAIALSMCATLFTSTVSSAQQSPSDLVPQIVEQVQPIAPAGPSPTVPQTPLSLSVQDPLPPSMQDPSVQAPATTRNPPRTTLSPGPTTTVEPPQVIRGPQGSQLVGIRQSPVYTSSFGNYLGLSSRESTNQELNRYYRSTARRRVIKVPEMFGDFRRFSSIASISQINVTGLTTTGELPHAGGVSGLKIAENNQAITANRAWFSYSHMHHAFHRTDTLGVTRDVSLDRFLFGFERTVANGAGSIEFRVPLSGSTDGTQFDAGTIGDISLIFKHLLYADQKRATSMGLGVELPTGDTGTLIGSNVQAELESNVPRLMPFFATTNRFSEKWFGHMFVQADIPAGGDDTLTLVDPFNRVELDVPPVLTASLDIGMGYWLFAPQNVGDSGLAVITEAHYTSRLGSADPVVFAAGGTASTVNFVDVTTDVLNITMGLHAELSGNWAIRAASSVPITSDKLFDSELILQVNRTF